VKTTGQTKTLSSLVLLSFTTVGFFAQVQPAKTEALAWKQLHSHYRRFDEIKPVLANKGGKPIYLSRLWPDGYAQLERFNETTKEWEVGSWGIRCGTVSHPTIPMEVSASGERKIDVYWQLSSDDWSKPKHFVVLDSLANRPLAGSYRLALRYSLKPWTLVNHPAQICTTRSPQFVISR
jgi:hypothetical protein